MQYTVTLVGANKFFEEFYHALANGNPVECAVSKGRQAVIEKYRTGRRDWGTPVLFMHSENGKIFDVKSKVAGKEKQKPERYNPINPSAMPDVSGYFVGKRDERLELLNLLKDTGKRIIIVHGLAGMGKTSLASKVVSENMDRFYAVFPFSIREYEGFEFLLRSINDFLAKNNDNSLQGIWNNPGIKVSDKIDCLIEALSGRDYLFIFDNFEDLLDENREIRDGEFKLLLDKIHKTKHKSKIIITTRFNFELSEGRYAGAMGSVLVDRFNEYGTIRFLNNLGLQDLDHETKKKIHERTGGHPFAIERFSGLAKKYSADSILKDDSLFRDDMEKKLTSKLYDAITQEEQDVLRRCSVFRGVFPLDAVKHFWGTLRTLNNLVDMHLIEHDERLDMYFIHRIIVDVAYNKFKTDKERKEAHKLAGEFYLNLNPIEAIDQFYLAEEFRKVIEVTEDIYQDLVTTGLWDEAIRKCEQGIEASRKISDRRYESISLGELGSMYMCRGDYENAENFFNKCLAIARQITNEKLIANSLHSLGICQAKKRNYEKAEELYIDSLKIARDINDEIGIAATLNQLGNIRLLNGKYEKAKEFYNESLEIKKHTGNKKGIATTIHQLGVIEHFQKNYEKAEKLYNESLEIAVQINAPELIAKILPQLSEIYKNRGDYKNAIKNLLIAENIFHKLNSPDTGGVLNNMMIIKEQLGEPEFNKYYNQAVKELQSG
jgi:tetratricopeptide (TPR) repeat protein